MLLTKLKGFSTYFILKPNLIEIFYIVYKHIGTWYTHLILAKGVVKQHIPLPIF